MLGTSVRSARAGPGAGAGAGAGAGGGSRKTVSFADVSDDEEPKKQQGRALTRKERAGLLVKSVRFPPVLPCNSYTTLWS